MNLSRISWAGVMLALITPVIPTFAAIPPALKSDRPLVKRTACELFLSGDRLNTFRDLIERPETVNLGSEFEYDLTGILLELAGYSYARQREAILHSHDPRQIIRSQGGSSVGPLLNTSLADLRHLDQNLSFKPGEKVVDLGSGHGAPAFYFAALYPDTEWTGFEIVAAKVEGAREAARYLGLRNVRFEVQDLGAEDFVLPAADTYYLLNPVAEPILVRLFGQMQAIAQTRKIRIVALGLHGVLPHLGLTNMSVRTLAPANIFESPIQILESN